MATARQLANQSEVGALAPTPPGRMRIGTPALVLPASLFLLITFVYPVGLLLLRSVSFPTWGIQNYATIFQETLYLRVLANTVVISGAVTLITLLLGYPYAYLMATGSPVTQRVMAFVVLVPFWTSILVRTYAWLVLLQRRGLVNRALEWSGLIAEPLDLVHNRLGVYIGMTQVLLPFMVFPLFAVMSRIDRSHLQAAANLGAAPPRVFRRVFLPLSLPGVIAGILLVFILSLGYYITPALLGGPGDIMIAQLIQEQIGEFGEWGVGAALAAVLLVGTVLLSALLNRFIKLDRIWGGQT
jgi:putative spermidine/putrescine transport system permease protein